ncbi:MAG TPA: AAA family ATPase [Spirochaetota bacterium]|nr:AAA family ATPase [Spirochaetota bacterium]
MGMMIRTIDLRNAGPIQRFTHTLAPLTLIYGHNESGKTTILENLVRAIFGGKKSRLKNLAVRGDDFEGSIKLTLERDGQQIALTNGLEAVLQKEETSLPADLFRLLYVRAGDSALGDGKKGLSRELVKGLVSNQQTWDRIRQAIPGEIGYTRFADGVIEGDRRGKMKQLVASRERLAEIRQLTDEFYATLSRAGIDRLRREEKILLDRLAEQEIARRHEAWLLAKKKAKEEGLVRLIDKNRLARLERLLDEYRTLAARSGELAKRIRQVQPAEAGLAWLKSAREHWLEFVRTGQSRSPAWPGYLAIGALVLSLAGMGLSRIAGVIFGIVAAAALVVKLVMDRRSEKTAGPVAELSALSAECHKRFGFEPKTVADLDAHGERLRDDAALFRTMKQEQDGVEQRLAEVTAELKQAFPDVASQNWGESLDALRARLAKHEETCRKYELDLARLGVDELDWLEEGNGIPYSGAQVHKLETGLDAIRDELKKEEEVLRTVQLHAVRLLQQQLPTNHEQAALLLEEARREAERDVRKTFAKLAAGHLVEQVLQRFLDEEDRRVESWMNDAGVGKLVHAVTGRYNRLAFEENELVVANKTERFALSSLSSGATEQVLLGVRMGIAQAVTGEETLFLLLDDAFQLSDWKRRGMLVTALGRMLDQGWQVVYFTMDDDIRQRMAALGKTRKTGEYCEIVL